MSAGEVFLGIIALATLSTAIVQIAVLVALYKVVRKIGRSADRLEQDVRPLLGRLDTISQEASRAVGVAAAQVDRVDRLSANVSERIERILDAVESAVLRPAKEGAALLSAFRAAIAAIREMRAERGRRRTDDEDALFI